MRLLTTEIDGVLIIEPDPLRDERGAFFRAYCRQELREGGVDFEVAQMNVSTNRRAGTIRGLHFQTPPAAETKLFRCTRGRTFHVAVDLRPGSPTHYGWVGVELAEESGRQFLIPKGCAAGYQALVDGAEAAYATDTPYAPGHEGGIRYDDPRLAIDWPVEATVVSEKDRSWPLLTAATEGAPR